MEAAPIYAPVYIHALRAEDLLRLELVELQLDGPGLTLVTGGNGEGKSSLLRSIAMALGGKDHVPEHPVRKGAAKGEVVLDLGDRVVKLKVKPDRSTTLTVEGKDGALYRSPQKMLDELVGALAFDPLAFADLTPDAQAAELRRLVGLDVSDLENRRRAAYDERTLVNRQVKACEGQLAGIVVPPSPAPVGEEKSLAEFMTRQRQANEAARTRDLLQREVATAHHAIGAAEMEISDLLAKVEKARALLPTLQAQHRSAADRLTAMQIPDLAAIQAEADTLEEHNAQVRAARAQVERTATAAKAREAKAAELQGLQQRSGAHTTEIERLDAEKAARLAAAQFPIPGLSIDGDTVVYNQLPLAQACTSEQLRVCLSIAAALNPRLRLMLVRQGNDLDADRLRLVAEWARDNGYQVLMERVAGDNPAGIVIEAGKVAGDFRVQLPPAKSNGKSAAKPAATKAQTSPVDDNDF